MFGQTQALEGEQRFDVRRIGVVAQQVAGVVRVRADDGDGGHGLGQGEQVALVLEQHQGFAGDLAGDRALVRRVKDGRHGLRVDIRSLEEAKGELSGQHAAHGAVDQFLRNRARSDRVRQWLAERVGAGQFYIHARFQRQLRGMGLVARQMMVRLQLMDRHVVGNDQPIEAPLVTQQVRQQLV